MLNMLIAIIAISALTILGILFQKKSEQPAYSERKNDIGIDDVIDFVKLEINKTMRSNLKNMGFSDEAYKRQLRNRSKFMEALKRCIWGSDNDKQFVKDVIYDILDDGFFSGDSLNSIIPFESPIRLSATDKFDILLYTYRKQYGKNALKQLIKAYGLDEEKVSENKSYKYVIDEEDIDKIYSLEQAYLNREDKIKIIAQRVYQRYKGFSVVDELRDMNVDGISGGVSGISSVDVMDDSDIPSHMSKLRRNYESAWVFFEGKSIHLSFLSFGSEAELKRVCQNIYRYNSSGMLSQDVGYKVSEMMDGSRVVVVRPDFSESWAFFVRKFHVKNIKLEQLIKDKNSHLPIMMIKYLAKGGRISAITGSQGSGKTTLLMAMAGEIYSALTLRVQEMSSELHLRRLYPERNILSFKETSSISGQEGLDVQKKTDGAVNILGEVASDEVAAWMIQMAQVASLFTLFTHHAKRAEDLILSLRNSLLKQDVFRNERVAEQQVIKVLDFDIHLKKDYKGKRYIERITEIVSLDSKLNLDRSYREKSGREQLEGFMDTVSDFFDYLGASKRYETRDIIRFENGRYVVCNEISEKQLADMKQMMSEEDLPNFEDFLRSMRASTEQSYKRVEVS